MAGRTVESSSGPVSGDATRLMSPGAQQNVLSTPTSLLSVRPDPSVGPFLSAPMAPTGTLLGLTLSPAAQPSMTASPQTEEFFDLIASSQSRRLDDQRASVGSLPGLRITHNNVGHLRGDGDPQEPGDEFFNMLIKYQVGLHPGEAWRRGHFSSLVQAAIAAQPCTGPHAAQAPGRLQWAGPSVSGCV
jgi:hypothetical protein